MYKILATGSKGNAVLYHNSILVDVGVSYSLIKPIEKDIHIVLLTHKHGDHINTSTLRKLSLNRPTLRIGACEWMRDLLTGFRNVDYYDFGKWYNYGLFKIATGKLYHDVPNCFYRIEKDGYKIFHATDTCHLKGISAKDYDLFAVEHNYDEETIQDKIREVESQGKYSHQRHSINSHLSEQQAKEFIFHNRKESSEVIRLHESQS